MPMTQKMEKYFGRDSGIWYCGIDECFVVLKTEDLKEKDKVGHILWGKRGAKDSQKISPICPFHGRFLHYGESSKESPSSDVTLM